MEQRETTRTVAQVVGQNMRRLRESRAKVLHDVASAARDLGLTWDPSAVSRIETGRREPTLQEFLALPLVMTLAFNEPVTMVDLLEVDSDDLSEPLQIFGREVLITEVLLPLAEPFIVFADLDVRLKGGTPSEVIRKDLDRDKRAAQIAREPAEERGNYREMQAVADELGVNVVKLMDACQARWGEYALTLSGERERRLLESGTDLSNPATVRTLRGHITRQLMAELRDYFDNQETDHGKR
jgi:transcriptional regulator with XRE-family HTH domain